jgi:hypothetical protein
MDKYLIIKKRLGKVLASMNIARKLSNANFYWSRTNYHQLARYSRAHTNFQAIFCRQQYQMVTKQTAKSVRYLFQKEKGGGVGGGMAYKKSLACKTQISQVRQK